jgi:hypothetical protein
VCTGAGKVHKCFRWGELRERDHLEELGVDLRIILKCVFKNWDGVMDWIVLVQDMDR